MIIATTILAAERPGGNAGNGKVKKKNAEQAKSKKGPSGPTPKQSTRASQMNQKKQRSSQTAPPWQVVSKKDMAKNIQAEKKRRELAQTEGIHNVKEDIELKVAKNFLSTEEKALLAWKRFAQSPQDEVDFIGAYLEKQLPPRLGAPEVAFLGRSNVGKSSLLNRLINADMARVGKTPGATASVNLYGIFRKEKAMLGLVDLPGFGYAKLSKETQDSVQETAENYLGKRKELMLGILLVDIRRVPSNDDRAVLAALFDMGVPIIVVATKVDKLSKTQAEESLRVIQQGLGLPEGQPLSVSSVTGQGIKEMWRIIMEACEGGIAELNTKMEQGKDVSLTSAPPKYLDDDEDVVYSQGFDWVHDSSSDIYDEDGEYYDDETDGEFEDDDDFVEDDLPVVDKQSLKFLRQKAKEMEKRGEL
jgi:GTP-binding protein